MHEYEVKLRNGTAYVYADCFVELGGVYQFYKGDAVVEEYDSSRVVEVKENW